MAPVDEESGITACFLNRTIVELRKTVEQCRVRSTRKLLNQLSKIRNKKGNEQQIEKNKRKADKLLAEVQEIKKIRADDVSKFALINTKTLPELMANASAEKAALYKLAMCNLLVNKIDDFREKHPKWHVEIPFTLQRLGLQYKTKRNVSKRNKSAEKSNTVKQKKIPKKLVEKNSTSGTIVEDTEVYESTSNEEKEQGSSKIQKKTKLKDKDCESTVNHSESKKEAPKVTKKLKKLKSDIKPEIAPTEKSAVVPLKEGKIGQMEVRRLRLDEIFGDEILPEENESNIISPDKRNPANDRHLRNDPFFANSDDEDENGEIIKDDYDENMDFLLEDDEENVERKKGKPNNLKTKFATSLKMGNDAMKMEERMSFKKRDMPPNRLKRETRNANLMPLGSKNVAQSSGENRKTRRMKMRQEVQKQAELASLHPSWQAKKKMNNPTLLPAAGKKIKFSDD